MVFSVSWWVFVLFFIMNIYIYNIMNGCRMLMLFMDFFVNDFHWDVSDTSWFQPMTLGRFFGPWVR